MGNIFCNTKKTSKNQLLQQRTIYEAAGQGHLLSNFDYLGKSEQESLLDELESFDPKIINKLYKDLVVNVEAVETKCDLDRIEPELTQSTQDMPNRELYEQKGLQLIKSGKVAVVILAGGQGSRLGFDHPKGMYDIGLPSKKSIF
jgi:UDP-N-acetylglucosamine/UDP-N-acetylgalactosamine diphosphorylase